MFAALAAACAVAAGTAQAQTQPTLSVDRECYWPGDTVRFTGQGFPAGSVMMLFTRTIGSDFSIIGGYEATADAAGALLEEVEAPGLSSEHAARETVSVAAYTEGSDGPAAGVEFELARFGVSVADWERNVIRPRRRTLFEVHGAVMNVGQTVYVHYSRARRAVQTVRLGRLAGPCGDAGRTMRQFPFRPRPGVYKVGFSLERRFDPTERVPHYKIRVGR
jgi:hypothetical protein